MSASDSFPLGQPAFLVRISPDVRATVSAHWWDAWRRHLPGPDPARAAFLIGPGPFTDLLNPAPLSLPGSMAGFAAGVGGAVLWRFREERPAGRSPSGNRS